MAVKEWKNKIKNERNKQKTVKSILTISIITLNVSGLNIPIKKQRLLEQMKKENKIQLYVVYKRPILNRKIIQVKSKRMVTKNKWAKDLNRHFSKEKISIKKISNKHLKRCLLLLIIRKIQTKPAINTA